MNRSLLLRFYVVSLSNSIRKLNSEWLQLIILLTLKNYVTVVFEKVYSDVANCVKKIKC